MSPLLLLVAGGALLALISSRSNAAATVTRGTVTLEAGVPYRIVVRAVITSDSKRPLTQALLAQAESTIRASIAAAGGSEISIHTDASNFVISYRAVNSKSSTVQVGVSTASGTIVSVTRLDGRPLLSH